MRRKTDEEVSWLRENAPWNCHEDTMDKFEERFGWRISRSALRSWMYRNGVKVEKSRKVRLFKAPEREWLKSHKKDFGSYDEAYAAFIAEFPESGKTRGQVRAWFKNHKEHIGGDTRFKKGIRPNTWKPVGTEKTWKNGTVYVKVREPLPPGERSNNHDGWRIKAHVVWEESNGMPFPDGHMVRYADGDPSNLDPSNLVAVPMQANAVITSMRIPYSDRESLERAVDIAMLTIKAKAKCEEAGVQWSSVRKESAVG